MSLNPWRKSKAHRSAPSPAEVDPRVREVAIAKLREIGHDPSQYTIQIREERAKWRVMFLPAEKRVRGGGLEIAVDKKSLQAGDVRFYQ